MADSEPIHKEGEEDTGGQFEPVIKLTEQVESMTHEEDEDILFKMRAKLFRFDSVNSEWKERGTGEVKLLQQKETKKIRLVMRREKTLKVCANHFVTSDMRLQPNIGSDRSWVWKVAADVSDGVPIAETLAIRFANSDNANAFKNEFERAQSINASLSSGAGEMKEEEVKAAEAPSDPAPVAEEKPAEATAEASSTDAKPEPAAEETKTEEKKDE